MSEQFPTARNQPLEQAMTNVASTDNPESRKQLYRALLNSMLLAPVSEIPPNVGTGMQTVQNEVKIHLISMTDRNQVRVTAVFTDLEALKNWDPKVLYVGLRAQDVFRSVLGTDIQRVAINPFNPSRKMIRPGGRVKRDEMVMLASGAIPGQPKPIEQFQLKKEQKVLIGTPAVQPDLQVLDMLRAAARNTAPVSALYLFQMATQEGRSHTVIGIRCDGVMQTDEEAGIVKKLAAAVQGKLGAGRSLDFMILKGGFSAQIERAGIEVFSKQ